MPNIEIIAIPSHKIIEETDDLFDILVDSMQSKSIIFQENDVLVIASKVVSVTEGKVVSYTEVSPSTLAKKLAEQMHTAAEFTQIILDECDSNYIGVVPGALTTISKYGLLANAGADQSNIADKKAIILPSNCKKSAHHFHSKIFETTQKKVGIIIADSRTMPMRLGTVGTALATFGFKSVIDEKGKKDLFGRPMHITSRAIADQLATTAELVMGETDERIPFVIIRNYPLIPICESDEKDINDLISTDLCMFLGPLMPCIKERIEGDK
ncbi:MAG: coenzyme F420-0:L-glutamate ligase [Candidatus Heimdallarchaeaceae archaeon]